MFAGDGALARTNSSEKISCSTSGAPLPPYSLGHEMPAQSGAWSFFWQRRVKSNPSSSPEGG